MATLQPHGGTKGSHLSKCGTSAAFMLLGCWKSWMLLYRIVVVASVCGYEENKCEVMLAKDI